MLPEQEDARLEKKWREFLGEKSEAWRVYTRLRDLILDDEPETLLDAKDLANLLGVSRNRLFTVILPKLESYGLLTHAPVEA